MTVGNRIKQCRLDLGMTQEELAIKMGYNGKSTVSAAENCGDNITTTKVKKFADALGVSFRYLMGYEDYPEDTPQAQEIRNSYLTNTFKLSEDEKQLIEAYRMLDKNVRKSTLSFILSLVNKKGQDSELSKAANDK